MTKLQHFSVLNFCSVTNMGEFMDFFMKYMKFTFRLINFTVLIGDIVE